MILFRDAGFDFVWPQLVAILAILAIGELFIAIALRRFRRTISQMA